MKESSRLLVLWGRLGKHCVVSLSKNGNGTRPVERAEDSLRDVALIESDVVVDLRQFEPGFNRIFSFLGLAVLRLDPRVGSTIVTGSKLMSTGESFCVLNT